MAGERHGHGMLCVNPPFTATKHSWHSFLLEVESTLRAIMWSEELSMKNSNETIENRTRDLPTCSAVPQPTVLPAACPRFLCLVTLNRWTGKVSFLFLVVNSSVRLSFYRFEQEIIWFNFVIKSASNIHAGRYILLNDHMQYKLPYRNTLTPKHRNTSVRIVTRLRTGRPMHGGSILCQEDIPFFPNSLDRPWGLHKVKGIVYRCTGTEV
jgi:hypothetical protein